MKYVLTTVIGIISFLMLWSVIPTEQECEIYTSTLRLHVVAASDSERDQSAKLKVRDAILDRVSEYGADSKSELISLISADKEAIEQIALDTLEKEGITDTVSLEIGEETYPTREYEGFSLPAGKYTSVRLNIGEAMGQNWWCVLFPPLCTAQAIEYDDEAFISTGLSKEQYYMITGNSKEYEIKFKLLELAANAFGFSE